jgi:hypothetical protein
MRTGIIRIAAMMRLTRMSQEASSFTGQHYVAQGAAVCPMRKNTKHE